LNGKPNITEAYFERVFNLGNYETFRLGLRATVAPKDDVEAVVVQLDQYTLDMRNKYIKRAKA
jgi:hypothetical protein